MGQLVDGKWVEQGSVSTQKSGQYKRAETSFRSWVTTDGSTGSSGRSGFKAESGRYHLYVSLACPWAHRTLIMRTLKGLKEMISVSIVHPLMAENGWTFKDRSGVIKDPIGSADFMYQVYTRADPDYTGRASVPVLWDKAQNTMVSNESSEIIRMFNSAFDEVGAIEGDYYPATLKDQIDAVNEPIYANVNNGVYRSGFATSQEAYDEAVTNLFATLDDLEKRLGKSRYLVGNRLTEADIRLFTTLFRFDPVYVGHFKCNIRRLVDYPNLWNYTRDIYQHPGVSETCDVEHCRQHYYTSHKSINPTGIVPMGPEIDFNSPHDRASRFG